MNKRPIFTLLGAIGAAGVAAYNLHPYLWQRLLKLPPVQNKVHKQSHIRVMMPDGVSLAADLYRPAADGRYPTVLIRTPYGRSNPLFNFSIQRMAERGYNVVSQDCRGRFDSEGDFEPYVHEADDGRATIEWIVKQPWSDGQVGMWGESYIGFVQWAAASTGTPFLKAIVPSITMSYLGYIPEEGYKLDRALRWLYILDAMQNENRSRWQNLLRLLNPQLQDETVAKGYNYLPLSTVDEAILGQPVSFYRTWMVHADRSDPYWQKADYRAQVKEIRVPAHHVAGWHDIFLSGQLADYEAMCEAGELPYLTVGPWTHLDFAVQWETLRQSLDWFDAHLKGQPEKLRPHPVRLYVMGANEWRDFDSWPPPAQPTPYHLEANGRLTAILPSPYSPPDHYTYNPADPTPNVGGALLSRHAGSQDNRELEARADVLTYTSDPLTKPLEIIGPIRLTLYVHSNLAHTDFVGRLCDVQPDGRSLNICDGFFSIEPGKGTPMGDGIICIELALAPTAIQFQSGHSIRLQVASGAHPHIARNLGTGELFIHSTEMATAEQTIYHDTAHPSTLVLPVV
jgi:putative CocE/NonD family hydrolase